MTARNPLLGLVARFEQEIRAYPRLHAAFYTTITRSPLARRLVGIAKDRVRTATSAPSEQLLVLEEPEAVAWRRAALARRLGLPEDAAR